MYTTCARLLICVSLFLPFSVSAAITLDSTSTLAVAGSASSFTSNHSILTNCSDRALVVAVAKGDDRIASNRQITSVTYNGTSTTLIIQKNANADGTGAHLYWLPHPDLGNHNIVVTLNGGSDSAQVSGFAFCGVSTTGAAATNTSITLNTGNTDAASVLIDVIGTGGAGSPGPFGTAQLNGGSGYDAPNLQGTGASYKFATSTSNVMYWSTGGIYGDLTGHASVELLPVASAATTTPLVLGNITSYEFVFVITCLIFIWIALLLTGKKVGKMIANIPHARL